MNKKEMECFLLDKDWKPFYSDNYWIKGNESDYSGVTLCEAYCREKYSELNPNELFNKVMEFEFILNLDSKLYIVGSTFKCKEELKKLFKAKYDSNKKCWWVSPEYIKDKSFHDYCYSKERHFRFRWEHL